MSSPAVAQTPVSVFRATEGQDRQGAITTADVKSTDALGDVLQPVGCASCSGCSGGGVGPAAIDLGGAPASCYPGKYPCDCPNQSSSALGSFLYGFYHCVCCPDPCYESHWRPLANAAFFVDQVRPITQMKVGIDCGWDVLFPDKAELFWAGVGKKGPAAIGNVGPRRLDYKDGYLYTEGAVDRFGLFVQLPYRFVDPDAPFPSGSGFGDMSIGTKSLLLDCELMQITFQFRTYLPTGNASKGVGTGHTSLEPSLIGAIKITESTYFQGQLAYLAPIGGDSAVQGSLITLGMSLNQLLWNCGKNLQWIGTLEGTSYWITNGQYTSPDLVNTLLPADDLEPMFNLGVGTRFVYCNTIDFGLGVSAAITDNRMVGQLLRGEFRWRF